MALNTNTASQKLQKNIDRLGSWIRKWGVRFQPVKCNMMQLTKKLINKIQASYTLECTVFGNVESIKYLGVTITNDLKWNTNIINLCTKANPEKSRKLKTLKHLIQSLSRKAYWDYVEDLITPKDEHSPEEKFSISKKFYTFY